MLFAAISVDAKEVKLANALRDLQLRALPIWIVALMLCLFFSFLLLVVFVLLATLLIVTGSDAELVMGAQKAPAIVILTVFGFTVGMTGLALSAHFYRAWAQRLGRPAGLVNSA